MIDDITSQIAGAFEACLKKGMQLPFVLCVASPNGSVLAARFTAPGTAMKFLATHEEKEGWRLPINIMIVDQGGEAARVTLSATGETWH